MAGSTESAVGAVADGLFDKYLLPKVALAVILGASLVGTALTGRLVGQAAPWFVLAKWGYFVALGVLAGGLLWTHAFVRPGDLETDAAAYCAAMYDRFDRLSLGALLVFVPAGVVVLLGYRDVLRGGPLVGALALSLAVLAVTTLAERGRRPVEARFRSRLGVVGLGAALLAVTLTALAEVALQGGGPVAGGVRVLHLLAFSAWLGGAVWNIFVAVPSGQARPTTPVVLAAGEQLERFRWTVRVVIPTLVLTGLVQAVGALGTDPSTYLGTVVGLAVLAKLGLVGVLVAIFLVCPMWRACSPIDGVCDLADLDRGPAITAEAAGGADD